MISFKRITIIGMAFFFSVIICNLFAWGTDVRVTADSTNDYTSNNNAWCVAAYEDSIVMTTYFSDRGGQADENIYAKRCSLGTWCGEVLMSNAVRPSKNPCLSSDGSYYHVVWEDSFYQHYELMHRYTDDHGDTWPYLADSVTGNGDYESYHPSCKSYGDDIHVAWRDDTTGNGDIYFKYWDGSSWGSRSQVSEGDDISDYPSVASAVFSDDIIWQENSSGNWDIWHSRSLNNGSSWGNLHNVTDHDSAQIRPCVAWANNYIHAVWMDNRNGNWDIYFARSTNGATWTQVTNLTSSDSLFDNIYPNISVYGTNVHVVWIDSVDSDSMQVCYKMSKNNGASWYSKEQVNDDTSSACMNASVNYSHEVFGANDSVYVHVVWYDDRNDSNNVYYDHYAIVYAVDEDPEKGGPQLDDSGDNEYTFGKTKFLVSPNPMNSSSTIRYSVSNKRFIGIEIHDITGRLTRTLSRSSHESGNYSIVWDSKNEKGEEVKPGIYFIKADGFRTTKLIKL